MEHAANTLAVFIGASHFPHKTAFGKSRQFRKSKIDFEDYLRRTLGLRSDAVLDLFDRADAPAEQLASVAGFLDRYQEENPDTVRNLFFYYVGHGYFTGSRHDYQLAIAYTKLDHESTTGLKVEDIAHVLKRRSKSYRFFYMLDCCFAGEALRSMMSDDVPSEKAFEAFKSDAWSAVKPFPKRGSALLCATSKDDYAQSPAQQPRTMFCDALVNVLESGNKELPEFMTLAEVNELLWRELNSQHMEPIRPVLYSPDQTEGDIAALRIFPNHASMQERLKQEHILSRHQVSEITEKEDEITRLKQALEKNADLENLARRQRDETLKSRADEISRLTNLVEYQYKEAEALQLLLADEKKAKEEVLDQLSNRPASKVSDQFERRPFPFLKILFLCAAVIISMVFYTMQRRLEKQDITIREAFSREEINTKELAGFKDRADKIALIGKRLNAGKTMLIEAGKLIGPGGNILSNAKIEVNLSKKKDRLTAKLLGIEVDEDSKDFPVAMGERYSLFLWLAGENSRSGYSISMCCYRRDGHKVNIDDNKEFNDIGFPSITGFSDAYFILGIGASDKGIPSLTVKSERISDLIKK